MLKDLILSYSSRRGIFKLATVLTGVAVLAFVSIDKVTAVSTVLWTASPLVLFWWMDVGLAAAQRRCVEWMKENPAKEDPSIVLWDGGVAGVLRFFRELISLSIWPFYLILLALVGFGGGEIAKANKEAAEAAQKAAAAAAAMAPHYPQGSIPTLPNRATNNSLPFNPTLQRFPTPPPFPMPNRPPVTPPKTSMLPAVPPNSSPAPAGK